MRMGLLRKDILVVDFMRIQAGLGDYAEAILTLATVVPLTNTVLMWAFRLYSVSNYTISKGIKAC